LSLVNSILDLNQIKAKKLMLNMQRIEVSEILKEVLCLFEFQFKMKRVDFRMRTVEPIEKFIVTDKNRLTQILINLVGNALKFTQKGRVLVRVSQENNDKRFLRFEVKDTGSGIKEEDKGKLFRMFGKLDNGNCEVNHQGVGLGLTISDTLARVLCDDEDVKGIKVESQYNKGSTFWFMINTGSSGGPVETNGDELNFSDDERERESGPLEIYQMKPKIKGKFKVEMSVINSLPVCRLIEPGSGSASSLSSRSGSRENSPRKGGEWEKKSPIKSKFWAKEELRIGQKDQKTILLVDDNLFNIAVGKHFIESLGYGVKTAYSGEEAIDIVMEFERIDLILMDCQMPGMSGYETTRVLRKKMMGKEVAEIPIVALTANDCEKSKEACMEAGMVDYLSKPLKEEELLKITKKYIE